jgi:probable F420-dependent oxidoreductase
VTKVFVSCGLLTDHDVVALAPDVERLGFDGITMGEHVFMPAQAPDGYPYTEDNKPPFALTAPWPDQFVLTGALSMVTERIQFMTTIVILPLRHPLLLAKAVAAAARLSQGRLILGIGVGWQRAEFDAIGVDFSRRGAIADEMIEALRTLWQPGPVEHHGRYFSFGPLYQEPVPPRVPILVGGSSDAARRRAVRIGDGYVLSELPFRQMAPHVASLREQLAAEGRSEEEFEIVVRGDTPTVEDVVAVLELNVDAIGMAPWPSMDATTHEERVERLEWCAEEILSVVRSHDRAAGRP